MTTALVPVALAAPNAHSGHAHAMPQDTHEAHVGRDAMHAAAVALLSRGYQLVLLHGTDTDGACTCKLGARCKGAGKHPREGSWTDRPIRTVEDLAARWERLPATPNIGVMPDDTLIVIDVDCKKGKRGAESLATLEGEFGALGQPQQTTPSGGWHYVFRLPGTDPATLPNRSDVAEGIDILRVGRQFVAAPSQIGPRRYTGVLPRVEELPVLPPTWLTMLQSLGSDASASRPPTDPAKLQSFLATLKAPSIAKVREAVGWVPNPAETDRKKYMWMAHAIKGACGPDAMGDGLDIFTEWASTWDGPVDPVEDERAFVTIAWRHVHTGWPDLWPLAARHGYAATEERLADLHAEFAGAAMPDGTHDGTSSDSIPLPRTLHAMLVALHEHLKTIDDALKRDAVRDTRLARIGQVLHIPFGVLGQRLAAFDAPHRQVEVHIVRPGPALRDELSQAPPQALVPRYIYADMYHVLYGTPQSLKTFTALDLGLHIASGLPWLGKVPVQRRGVVFFAGEAASSLRVRIAAWCAARHITVEQAATLPFALIDAVPTFGTDDGLRDAIARVEEAAKPFGVPVGFLVLDNMTRIAATAGLSTTDTGEYGRILAGIDSLGRATQAATLTIYHVPVSDPDRPSGTYQSSANPDVIMKAERHGAELRTLIRVAPPFGKSRPAAPPPDLLLQYRVQDVRPWLTNSYDRDGSPRPPALAAVADELPPVSEGEGDGVAKAAPESPAHEALRQQFTSLVIDIESDGQAPMTAHDPGAEEEAERRRNVLYAIERHPGASGADLRALLRGTRKIDVDRAVLDLVQDDLVRDEKRGNAHAYQLTALGHTELKASRARDHAAVAASASVLDSLEPRTTDASMDRAA